MLETAKWIFLAIAVLGGDPQVGTKALVLSFVIVNLLRRALPHVSGARQKALVLALKSSWLFLVPIFIFHRPVVCGLMIVGNLLNISAMLANGNRMPVDMRAYRARVGFMFGPDFCDGIHVVANDETRLKFLIDRFSHRSLMHGIGSIGDILIEAGPVLNGLLFIASRI